MTVLWNAELVNKFSKNIKTIRNRMVEVEFYWYQSIPCQIYRLHIDEEQYNESQKYIRSKKLLSMKFEEFTNLITPVFANEAAEISNTLLRSTFDRLFDQNSNGTIEPGEFDSLFILLHGLNSFKLNLFHENLRQIFGTHAHHISFKEFYDSIKSGYLREFLMS